MYVDMTTPYMDLGLTVLLPKDHTTRSMFVLFEPFEWSLWVSVMVATWVVAVAVTLCSFVSPLGYRGRYVQRRDKSDNKDQEDKALLNYHNGFWFSLASVLEQVSSEIGLKEIMPCSIWFKRLTSV